MSLNADWKPILNSLAASARRSPVRSALFRAPGQGALFMHQIMMYYHSIHAGMTQRLKFNGNHVFSTGKRHCMLEPQGSGPTHSMTIR